MYIVSTVLFHKYGGANFALTNCMSHFSMFFPTKATVKLSNGNTVYDQIIVIVLCCSPNCSIIYPFGPVYYFPGHSSNTISSGALKFYIIILKVASEPLEHCEFFDPQSGSCKSPYQTQNNLDYLQLKIFKVNPHRDKKYCCTNCLWNFKKISLNLFINVLVMSLSLD